MYFFFFTEEVQEQNLSLEEYQQAIKHVSVAAASRPRTLSVSTSMNLHQTLQPQQTPHHR